MNIYNDLYYLYIYILLSFCNLEHLKRNKLKFVQLTVSMEIYPIIIYIYKYLNYFTFINIKIECSE